MTPPTVAICDMFLLSVNIWIHALAADRCLLLAAAPKSEPPRNTGAVWPELWLGIGKAPSLSVRLLSLPVMTPTSQPLAMIIAMWPWANASSCLASSPVLSARESAETSVFSSVSPCCELDELSEPCHLPPDWVAMSPPKSQTKGSAAYQYLPGKYRAEKFGSELCACISFWPTVSSWSMLVGGWTPAASKKSLR